MDWKSLGNRLLDLWGRSALTRFCSFLVTVGAGLLTLSWIDVAAAAIGAVIDKSNPDKYSFLPYVVGIGLIGLGIIGRLALHFLFAAWHEKRVAGVLIGRLRVLVNGFAAKDVKRDAGYYNKEIQASQTAARDYLAIAPSKFTGSEMLASIANPKFDASKEKPYIDSTLEGLKAFIEQLRTHYEIK